MLWFACLLCICNSHISVDKVLFKNDIETGIWQTHIPESIWQFDVEE